MKLKYFKKILILLILVLSFLFFSCEGMIPASVNEVKKELKIIEESIYAENKGDKMELSFEVSNTTDEDKEIELEFKINTVYNYDYDYGTTTMKIDAKQGVHSHNLVIDTPQIQEQYYNNKTDYMWFNIYYSLYDGNKKKVAVKSLYTAMLKYNLQVIASDQWEAESKVPVKIGISKAFSDESLPSQKVDIELIRNDDKTSVITKKTVKTSKEGDLIVELDSPKETGSYTLSVKTKSPDSNAEEVATFPINVNKNIKIYITTDKPMYQPGQKIHIRALALGTSKIPVGNEDVIITVLDGKGNKVFKKEAKTNEFGVTSAEFQLASFVNLGHYKIEVEMKETTVEKTISVERYVLPKFKVSMETDKEFYSPGEEITGTVTGKYFFGKPVSESELTLNLYTFDVEWNLETTLTGFTNKDGNYDFKFQVPDYLIGSQLEQGSAFVRLEIILTDNAKHTQGIDKTIPISESPIVPVIFPETENFSDNMELKFFVITADPLGRPMATQNKITVGDETINVKTNETGIASFTYYIEHTPFTMKINSKAKNYTSDNEFFFSGGTYSSQYILLRTNKPTYKVGDTIKLDVLSSFTTKKIYIDVIKENKTLLTKTLELKNKSASLNLPISSDMDGVVRVAAYSIQPDSSIIRDTRSVYIDAADDIKINITPDKETYLPGEDAKLNISVTDNKGKGKQSAVGFVIVDEAVYALQENKPGLEKVYFEVEEALKEPKYEIHSFSYQDIFIDDYIEPMKAEIFLTATNQDIDFGIEYSSAFKDISSVKSSLQYYIDEQTFYPVMEKFYNLMYKSSDILRDTKTSLVDQVRDIIENERILVYDLWKQEVKISLKNKVVSVISAGIDKLFGTKDDFIMTFDVDNIPNTYWDYQWRGDMMFLAENEDMANGAGWNDAVPVVKNEMTEARSADNDKKNSEESSGEDDSVRVRKYFPETLHVEPSLITDSKGKGEVSLTIADSITQWRVSSTANTKTGELGSSVSAINVFQEFFIDIDFPVELTQNDEVSVPIAIYNYLDKEQTIKLTVKEDDWFELLDDSTKSRKLKPDQVTVEYFRIKVKEIGTHAFQVTAKGSTKSDAIERRIRIKPDGDPVELSYSDRLDGTVEQIVTLSGDAIDKSQQVIVKIYPGLFSQVVEGLDSLFRLPSGCFEQTSSTTYPNILALKYMQDSGIISPEIEMKASTYINQGYQRLLTFEVPGGGFEWFGSPPAHNILTAYGLMEFYDMSFVHTVDSAIINRTQNYLVSKQNNDGSFPPDDGGIAEGAINAFQGNLLRNTGYICWSLAYSEYKGEAVQRAVSYIKKNIDLSADSYTLAILANALLTVNSKDKDGKRILSTLDERKKKEGNGYYWEQTLNTSMYGSANVAVIETTALVAYAMMNGKSNFNLVEGAINYLITQKDTFGNWSSTQSTIATLRTFIKSLESGSSPSEGTIRVMVGNKTIKNIEITKSNYDVMQQIDVSPFTQRGDNKITLELSGDEDSSFLYQIAGTYYIPRKTAEDLVEPISISINYDKTSLKVDDMVTVEVGVSNNYHDVDLGMMIVDLGIAPGFDVVMEDFEKYLEKKMFTKVEPAGRQLVLYIDEMKAKEKLNFEYRMKARYPMKVKSPSSTFYSYYGDEASTITPVGVEVKE